MELHLSTTALEYGRVTRSSRKAGRLIGTNDLWIAAASLRYEIPLATPNTSEFRRIPGLEVVAYKDLGPRPPSSTAARMARMCSGPVPQQPPMNATG